MRIGVFFRLIRWKNLALIFYTQVLVHFVLFQELEIHSIISDFIFFLICFATVLIAGAGNTINDIRDIETDSINKPDRLIVGKVIDSEQALKIYRPMNAVGLLLGGFVAMRLEEPASFFYFLIPAALLYFYSNRLKSIPLIGNFTIAMLTSFSIIILGLFELPFELLEHNVRLGWAALCCLAIFAFLLNCAREIIKDIMDMKGDFNAGLQTLPIIIGINRSRNIIIILLFLVLTMLLTLIIVLASTEIWISVYMSILLLLPLLFLGYKLINVNVNGSFKVFSSGLKIIMFMGINTLLLLLIK